MRCLCWTILSKVSPSHRYFPNFEGIDSFDCAIDRFINCYSVKNSFWALSHAEYLYIYFWSRVIFNNNPYSINFSFLQLLSRIEIYISQFLLDYVEYQRRAFYLFLQLFKCSLVNGILGLTCLLSFRFLYFFIPYFGFNASRLPFVLDAKVVAPASFFRELRAQLVVTEEISTHWLSQTGAKSLRLPI